MRMVTGPLSGQGTVEVAVKSLVDFSHPVGGMCSLKEMAELCINVGAGQSQES